MNKRRPTLHRITWTTEGLNFFLDVQGDVDDLRISQSERESGFAKGTLEDAKKLTDIIIAALGVVEHRVKLEKSYEVSFWFGAAKIVVGVSLNGSSPGPISDKLEQAFAEVGDVYVKNQEMWDDAQEVESDSDGESEDESDSEQDRSDMEEETMM
jgi:hypothetical protein